MPTITSAATVALRPSGTLTVSAFSGGAGTAVFTPPTGGLSRSVAITPLGPFVVGPFDRVVSVVLTPSAGTLEYTESYPSNTEADPPAYTWANRPLTGVPLNARIRVIDVGITPGMLMVWDGTRWIPDGVQVLARTAVASAALTGTTDETVIATITIPAGIMGLNGTLQVSSTWTYTNGADDKTLRGRMGGISGTAYLSSVQTTTATASDVNRRISNRNSAASQIGSSSVGIGGTGASALALPTSTVDTSAQTTFVLTGQLENAADQIILQSYVANLLP